MFEDGVLEPERVKSDWRLERLLLEVEEEVVEQQSANLVHPCVILLLVIVELVVEVVPCMLLGKSQVGGKVVDAFTHSLLLLMQSTLCTKEVTLGDE